MNFTDWYEIEENSKVLKVNKNIEKLDSYNEEKYDYIFLDGCLENANKIIKSEEPCVDFLKFYKEKLNKNGTLLIAVDNAMGVKYLVGNKSEHCNKIYDSLKKEFKQGELFTKKELDKVIEKLDFKYSRYYYPLPDYKQPNVIFTEEYLPDENNSKINYNIIYNENSLIVQDELNLLKMMIQENKFIEFTNSYIIELSNKEIDKQTKYYSFNNMRKDKYALILKMNDNYVTKIPTNNEAIDHIKKIHENSIKLKELGFNIAEEISDQKQIRSKFIKLELLDKHIVKLIDFNEKEKVYELIDDWYKYISNKLNVNEQGIIKNGFIDMVFENTFYNEEKKEYIFFDQEWYKENIQIKFLLYRAISNLYAHNPKIEKKILKTELFKKYNINENDFKQQEEDFQKEVIDEKKREFYAKQYKYIISSEELLQIIKDVKKLDVDNIELLKAIQNLNEEIKKRDKTIEDLLNKSITYKIKKMIKRIR